MSETRFTPGPWFNGFDDLDGVFASDNIEGNVICQPPDHRMVASMERWVANAYLIAAAPELYEAATALLSARDALENVPVQSKHFEAGLAAVYSAEDAVRAALSKARGDHLEGGDGDR